MGEKKKIVIVDDDADILDVTTIILEGYGGYEVAVIDRGEELKSIKRTSPDLILLDLWMSGFNGQDICKALKGDEQTKTIPVILFSANRELKAIAESCGADDFISKPYQMDDLLEKVAAWV
jgi:CheY-like chemotaxis protein